MYFDSYKHALQFLHDHYGGFREVVKELNLEVGAQWLNATLHHEGRNPSDRLKNRLMDRAEDLRRAEYADDEPASAEDRIISKIEDLHDEYGSWNRVARRVGVGSNQIRLAVNEGKELPEDVRQKVREAHRRHDLEEIIGYLALGIGIQMCDALRETDLSHAQRKIIDKAEKQLDDYNRLMQTGNMSELRDEIKQNGYSE